MYGVDVRAGFGWLLARREEMGKIVLILAAYLITGISGTSLLVLKRIGCIAA